MLYSMPTHRSRSARNNWEVSEPFFLVVVWVPSLLGHGNLCCSRMGRVRIPPSSTKFALSSSRASHHHEREILRFPRKQKNQLLFSPAQSYCRAVLQPPTSTSTLCQQKREKNDCHLRATC